MIENAAGTVAGIEVKASAIPHGISAACMHWRKPPARASTAAIVLYTGTAAAAFGPRLYALPLSALWESQEV